ncbi:MAG: tRNA uridine-5-carboxymethylaminomethyl(34) synthesis GTPase MnmE [Lachnospiraceae bacterium]|nr:tRNA uridine-5-carboxymethylaminomethyl(34) synthesis GTPase MnmE [Lachnospiraceae bacterium]
MSDTIAAISTAPGEGGIGVVRVSGDKSIDIMRRLMKNCPEKIVPRHAYFGTVVRDSKDPSSEIIDEAIFIYMKSPFSYTGEDMLEIQGHGSNVSLKNILSAILDSDSQVIRMADPGEFTKIAFLNGKMDLSQAEAVIDIIKAKTDLSLEIAQSQREGRLGDNIRKIRETLLNILAEMAVDIDYPDDDYNDSLEIHSDIVNELRWVLDDVEKLLDTASIGKIAREGIRTVIVGKPNAGKSSLMNAILGEGRVIVTDIPGTTRDTVEENVSLGGIPIVLIDTAGLRESENTVEKIGIERTVKAIAGADILMLVIDGSKPLDIEDEKVISYVEKMNHDNILVVINKEDLGSSVSEDEIISRLPGIKTIITSLVGKGSIEAAHNISEIIAEMINVSSVNIREMNIITNERHIKMLKNAIMNLDEAISMLQNGEPIEVAELSAHYAYDSLGNIIGEDVGDEILNTVFSKFCLGK